MQLFVSNLDFNHFEAFTEATQGWTIDFQPLSPANTAIELQQIVSPQLIFSRTRFDNTVDQRGCSPLGFRTFGLLASGSSPTQWCNHDMDQHSLTLFPRHGEFSAISYSGFNVYTFAIEETLLLSMMETLYPDQAKKMLSTEGRVVSCMKNDIQQVRSLLHMLSRQSDNPSTDINALKNIWQRVKFEEQLAEQLFKCLKRSGNTSGKTKNNRKDIALKRAIDYIESTPLDLITAYQLSKVCSVSQRSLEHAFKEKYGLTPKAYIKCKRLYRVHKQLYHTNDNNLKINEIAIQHGFWHMGQFAADYKKMFGELPSKTYIYKG